MDPQQLALLLRDEHPQVVALALLQLAPAQAALALAALPAEIRGDVAARMATADRVDPAVMRTLFAQIARRVPGLAAPAPASNRVGGVAYLSSVLRQVDPAVGRAIVAGLDETDVALAEQVRRGQFTFDDLAHLSDRDLQRLWRELRHDQVALALRDAGDAVKSAFLRNVSQRARQALVEEIDRLGLQLVSKIHQAQDEIVDAARRLGDAGEISTTAAPGERRV